MHPYYWFVAIVGLVILSPLLFTPVGWGIAVLLVAVWIIVSIGGKLAWNVKMNREEGMRNETTISDHIAGNNDGGRWRR